MERHEVETVIIGAGPAGLAVGAALRRRERAFVILERADRIASSWHGHYHRLHLHTDRDRSGLPYHPFPKSYPKYPSRAEVIEYLEGYAERFDLRPRFGEEVVEATRTGDGWRTRTSRGAYLAPNLVVATGYNRRPYIPSWPGREGFGGMVLHSSEYRSGAPFRDRRVLVVGIGNSGAEIAIDLCEHGARVALSVRSPVSVIPRDIVGIPILAIAIPMSRLPARVADLLSAPIVRLTVGDLRPLGLEPASEGPFEYIEERSRIPLIDVGTLDCIRSGRVEVVPGVRRFTADGVQLEDGRSEPFDAVVLATGYRPAVHELLPEHPGVADAEGTPYTSGDESADGLFFCGFHVTATGMLREIALEADRIGRRIAERAAHAGATR